MRIKLLLSVILFIAVGQLYAQDKVSNEDTKTEKSSDKKEKVSKEKTYDDFITKDAITDKGLFDVHKVDENYFYEIQIVSLGVKCWLSHGLPKQQVELALVEASKILKFCVGKNDQEKYYFVWYHIKSSQPILYRYMKRLLIQILNQYYIVLM